MPSAGNCAALRQGAPKQSQFAMAARWRAPGHRARCQVHRSAVRRSRIAAVGTENPLRADTSRTPARPTGQRPTRFRLPFPSRTCQGPAVTQASEPRVKVWPRILVL
jgi:hypothetical protein